MTETSPRPAACGTVAIAAGLLLAPGAAVLQSQAVTPVALVGLAVAVALHRRQHGTWPRPGGALTAVLLALAGWAGLTALWAAEPGRALVTAAQLAGYALLGGAACAVVVAAPLEARRRLLWAAAAGLGLGLVMAGFDLASGNALRAAVRGLREIPPTLVFGLKPAASVLALLLPLLAAVPGLGAWWRAGLSVVGAAVVLALPGEAARLAVLAAAVTGLLAWWAPRAVPRLLGAVLAGLMLAMPWALEPVLARGLPLATLPHSAAHRVLIWDLVVTRIGAHPLRGWGLEASRTLPGGQGHADAATLARFGLEASPDYEWFRTAAQLLPLHPHNGALQFWLELGLPGAVLGALLLLLLGRAAARCARPAIASAMLASAFVTFLLSFGTWQEWWLCAELLAVCAVAALPARSER